MLVQTLPATCLPQFSRITLLCIFAFCCNLPAADAQLDGRIAEKPLGVGYTRNLTQKRLLEYTTKLSERIAIGESFRKMLGPESKRFEDITPHVEVPISGAAYYMVQSLIPSFETMYFQQVADLADAKRMVDARKNMFGPNGSLKEEGDDRFTLINSNSWNPGITEGKTAAEHAESINKQNAGRSRQYRMSAKVVEKDGKEAVEQTYTNTEYLRFHDNLLFSAGFNELLEIDLPTADSLTSTVNSSNDMGIELFFDRIPSGMKQLAWGMLNGGAGAQMQQRDGEEQSIADLRKRSIEFGLTALKALMFDTDQVNGWFRFASEEEQSIRGELNFETRSNSELSKRLEDASSGNSRFGAVLRDEAPATLHLCIRIFEESDPMLDALGQWLIQHTRVETSSNAAAVSAASEVAASLNAVGEHRTLEVLLKADHSEESDGVIYGGVQADHNPNLLRSVFTLASTIDTPPGGLLELIEKDGLEVMQINLPESDTEILQKLTSLKFTHVYITHSNACLWFAAGGENAYEKLRVAVGRCSNADLAARAPLFTANVDVNKWLQLPEDDPTGVGNLLRWMDENMAAFPPGPMSFQFGRREEKPTPLLNRVLELGGAQDFNIRGIADAAGLRLSLNIGEAIGNYYVARMVDMQDRMMSQQVKQMEEAQKKAKDAAKTLPKVAPE